MKITPLYETAKPPMDGYDGIELRVLLNPAGSVWEDFARGGFSANEQERALIATLEQLIADAETTDEDKAIYRDRCDTLTAEITERTRRMGCALCTLYGTTEPLTVEADGGPVVLDFTTPEAALRAAEEKRLPDELAFWLVTLPHYIIERRRTWIRENLGKWSSKAS